MSCSSIHPKPVLRKPTSYAPSASRELRRSKLRARSNSSTNFRALKPARCNATSCAPARLRSRAAFVARSTFEERFVRFLRPYEIWTRLSPLVHNPETLKFLENRAFFCKIDRFERLQHTNVDVSLATARSKRVRIAMFRCFSAAALLLNG